MPLGVDMGPADAMSRCTMDTPGSLQQLREQTPEDRAPVTVEQGVLDRMELTGPPSSQCGVYKIPSHRLALTRCPMPDLEAAQSAVGGEGCKGENTADVVVSKDQAHTTGTGASVDTRAEV